MFQSPSNQQINLDQKEENSYLTGIRKIKQIGSNSNSLKNLKSYQSSQKQPELNKQSFNTRQFIPQDILLEETQEQDLNKQLRGSIIQNQIRSTHDLLEIRGRNKSIQFETSNNHNSQDYSLNSLQLPEIKGQFDYGSCNSILKNDNSTINNTQQQEINTKNGYKFDNLQNDLVKEAKQTSDYNFNLQVKRRRYKIHDQLKQGYTQFKISTSKDNLQNNEDELVSPWPQSRRNESKNQSVCVVIENNKELKVSNSLPMIGSLKIKLDKQNQLSHDMSEKVMQKVYRYPTISENILPQRSMPQRLIDLDSNIDQNLEKLHFKLKDQRHIDSLMHTSQENSPQNQKSSLIKQEVCQNLYAKALIRQSDMETQRLQLAQQIQSKYDFDHNSLPNISPLKINPEEERQIERLFNSRNRQRYLLRVKKTKDRKYNKYWNEYHLGQGRPPNHPINIHDSSFEKSKIKDKFLQSSDSSQKVRDFQSLEGKGFRDNKDLNKFIKIQINTRETNENIRNDENYNFINKT
eukprot:403372040